MVGAAKAVRVKGAPLVRKPSSPSFPHLVRRKLGEKKFLVLNFAKKNERE